ncbi:Tellurite resistance protein TerB [Synechococcus sp. PCC 7502]|uniref:tellurite resistance TerB family protein n=1 Tax=Synechococcus sp. PCC 7502 TaxID=1173263 RepID=UPI00029F8373|nr:TerB family tellurite resistance protein [Synechococcus sp. PCC 7502]AFY73800.1 Tellurite resistance protein TerB [Synechococcus sp. PCC 7502]
MIMEPLPPAITPYQMDILRVVTAMAWSDGELEVDEITVMLEQFAQLFASSDAERSALVQELREYFNQNLPLEDCLKRLRRHEDKQLVLKLSYQVIQASRRQPDEPLINLDEAAAYQKLKQLLELSDTEVAEIEAEVTENLSITDIATNLQALTSR